MPGIDYDEMDAMYLLLDIYWFSWTLFWHIHDKEEEHHATHLPALDVVKRTLKLFAMQEDAHAIAL